ncbi:ATP-grasp domain-containing protein [Paraburkholderia sp. Tr-20389]|uniref:ATP-grasp domain-containing protein n=1 Tax=Paraburkholderia sp. Tr-20389 TaxID=2703903 RepID=UPI0019823EE1|nr:ATP-grasp domain-containing protein [Paraburkholderia sp. Tr-20389]MBN3758198.1 ATP-grasp domain-containing protein [Paraburkholderia sp. Tr-20389]
MKLWVYEYLTGGGIDAQLAGSSSLADLSALVVEGRVMRDAIVGDLRQLDGVQVSFASSRFEQVAQDVPHGRAKPGESMLEFVSRASREHDFAWIVAPECDGLMLDLADAVGPARWIGCTKEAIALASSKRATAARLAARGIDVTPALEPAQIEPGNGTHTQGRWVVKPDDGAGGLDTFVFDDAGAARAEYAARCSAQRETVLQAWVEGEPLSLSLICNDAGATLVSINRQRIEVAAPATGHAGRVVGFEGVDIDRIARDSAQGRTLDALARQVAASLPGLRGFVGIDVVWNPERGPVVIEVNPRATVAYAGLSARLGRNLAVDVLAAHGLQVSPRAHEAASDGGSAHARLSACGTAS